jgi:outer membrane protein OmpA-like peptidoglycan-associated protein
VVKDFLIGNGVSEERVADKGYGKSKPIMSNETETGRKKNQRIELKIIAIE